MPTYTVRVYNSDPLFILSQAVGDVETWTGEATPSGTATITDTETGIEGQTLDSNVAGGETATLNITIGGDTSTGAGTYAAEGWTLRDAVTGEEFNVITLRVVGGDASGFYTLSEIPLVAGRTYETLAYNDDPNVLSGDPAFDIDAYEPPGEVVDGTAGSDTIDASFVDGDGDSIGEGADTVFAGAGDDSVTSDAGDDLIFGGLGADTIDGGDGDDILRGGEADGGSAGTGGSTTAGDTFTVINLGTFADVDPTETNGVSENADDLLGVYGGFGDELYNSRQTAVTFDSDSDGRLDDNDTGATPENIVIDGDTYQLDSTHVFEATVTFADASTGSFTAVVSQTTTGETFLMPEFSANADNTLLTSQPIVSISLDAVDTDDTALVADRLDADYRVPLAGSDTSGDSIDGGAGNDTIAGGRGDDTLLGGDGADLIEGQQDDDSIDGGAGDDTLEGGAGDDTLTGGTGADSFFGGLGDDEIYLAQGDTAQGGDGDDLFVLNDLAEPGSAAITLTGGEGAETDGDTLQLTSDITFDDITFSNTDDAAGGLSGSFTMSDGTAVTFSEIENIICFTPGTRILTPRGERRIEDLRTGDLVVTRDSGPQAIRWIGHRSVAGRDRFAPIAINSTVMDGARRPLLVSPQHRILFTGYKAQLLFGESEVLVAAKHLVDGRDVRVLERPRVTYFHMMLDRHEVVYAEGAATESFHAGDVGIGALSPAAREDMFRSFPQLRADLGAYGPTARPCLKKHEAGLLRVEDRALCAAG